MIAKKRVPRLTSIISIEAKRFSARNAPASPNTIGGTRRKSNLPVSSATAITAAKTASAGAGSMRTTASRSTPRPTAAWKLARTSARIASNPRPRPTAAASDSG